MVGSTFGKRTKRYFGLEDYEQDPSWRQRALFVLFVAVLSLVVSLIVGGHLSLIVSLLLVIGGLALIFVIRWGTHRR